MEHFRWQLTTSGSGRRVSAIPAWCVYESTGFHLGNIGEDDAVEHLSWVRALAALPAVAAVPEPQAPGANHLEHGGELRVAGGDCHEHPEPHWHPAFGPGLADAGYWSEANIRACSRPEMPELLIATTKDWKQRKMLREKGCPRGRIPKGLSPWDRMERKLLTKRGRALYKKRGVLVEPVFGQVKEGQGFRRFMRRGLGAAQSEWSLAGMTHNLFKLWRSGQAPWGWALAPWN